MNGPTHEWVQANITPPTNPPNWECRVCGAVMRFQWSKPTSKSGVYTEFCNEFIANKVLSE